MAEFRFYRREVISCGQCGIAVEWRRRESVPDSWMLVHPNNPCKLRGKFFYPPPLNLNELPEDMI